MMKTMNRILKKWVALAALLLLSAGTVCGQPFLRLPAIVGDHMCFRPIRLSRFTAGPIPMPGLR